MDISKRRQQIYLLYRQMGACLKILLSRPPMGRGIVYELKRKCGNPNCRCTRGELHRSPCLSYYIGGEKRKLTTVKEHQANTKYNFYLFFYLTLR
jgi:hypothetical protein